MLVDELDEEMSGNIDEVKMAEINLAEDENMHKKKCSSCTLYILLFSIVFRISIRIGTCFIY